jgi:uncharacterized repeat protein (TIGR01451 family)
MWVHQRTLNTKIYLSIVLGAILGLTGVIGHTAPDPAGPANPVAFLTGPNNGDPLAIARQYLAQNRNSLGLSSIDIAGALVTDQYTSRHNGVTHVYLRQQHQGIEVHNANININIAADGSVINLGNRFVPGIDTAINTTVPFLTRGEAISAAAHSLGLDPNKGPVSRNPMPTKLVYQPVAKSLVRLAWELEIYELDGANWWSMRVDAVNGAVLDQNNYVARDSYNVYAVPVESPSHGPRSDVSSPADTTASPSGWVGTQCTAGNNVDAYLDTNNSNTPTGGDSARACNTNLDFNFPIDLTKAPNQYQSAAVTNLFYWNNLIHDVFYQYGFDEASGNFQQDNFGGGGEANDSVFAEAQDGGGVNNANFATPPDGFNPRMQMYLWALTNPDRDGDLDNGIVIHEYGHGISVRLTGGPATSACLSNTEQAGEGWSDFFAVLMTIEPGDMPTDPRGVGTYALGQPTNGTGIRDYPYSTDMVTVDPRTYDWIKVASVPHGVGSTWTAMLWEMTWALIGQYGFSTDLYSGTGGNNIALQLVVDGLKLQPCSPGFVDARDAILLADQINNGGANQCLIWDAFSKRGLGLSANQGSTSSRSDGVEAFDTPLICQEVLSIATSANPDPVEAGQTLTYSVHVQNTTTGILTNVTATDAVPSLATYVTSSATCGGFESAGTVTFPLGTMASGGSGDCEFQVTVNPSAATVVMSDDVESGRGMWVASHGAGTDDWAMTSSNPHSPTNAWFAPDTATSTDQYLTLASPIAIGNSILKFWHYYDTEADWDGGVVEISVNGGAWIDTGDLMFRHGYNSTINTNPASDISGRKAFSGNSGGYVQTAVDLSSYAGDVVQIRFRMATDGLVGGVGWYIDDVSILNNAVLSNQACVTAAEGDNDCSTVTTLITPVEGPPPPPAPQIAVSPLSLSSTQDADVETSQTLTIDNVGNADLTWNVMTDSGVNCVSPDNTLPWASASPDNGLVAPSTNANVDISFNSAGLAPGYSGTGSLCVFSNDSGSSPITVSLALAVSDPGSGGDLLATGEIAGKGAVTGNYIDTHVDDGVSEMIVEVTDGNGKPSNRFDVMEHTWEFDLQSGVGLTMNANVWVIDSGNDGDEIRFLHSSDNTNFTSFYTLSSPDNANLVSVPFPDQNAGPLYIKAVDSNKSKGHNNPAILYVDNIYIGEGGPPMDPSDIVMTVSSMVDESVLSNRRNRWDPTVRVTVVEDGSSTPVEGAVVNGFWSNGASGGGSCTTGSSGECTIKKPNVKTSVASVDFTVSGVTRGPSETYLPSVTTVTLFRP